MATGNFSVVYDEFLDYLLQKATPEEILAFKVSEETQQRAEELLDRNNDGLLSANEQIELNQMLEFERLMSVLKSRAMKALRQQS